MLRFAAPQALLLLALLPLSARYRKGRRPAVMAAANLHPAAGLQPSPALLLHRLVPWMYTLVLVLLVAALARPQWGVQGLPAPTSGVDIILAVDLSESMAAMDFRQGDRIINRLEAVKGVVADFVARRGGDRIGMVVFGSRAYTQMPLTHDHAALTGGLEPPGHRRRRTRYGHRRRRWDLSQAFAGRARPIPGHCAAHRRGQQLRRAGTP